MVTILVGQELIISAHCIVRIYPSRHTTSFQRLYDVVCLLGYGRNTLDDCDLFKCYVILYNCASTRGVILELVPDASSKYFVYSLRKFISCRGCPGKILTDNGTVFTSQETQRFATKRNIEW